MELTRVFKEIKISNGKKIFLKYFSRIKKKRGKIK